MAVFEIKALSFSYAGSSEKALDNVTLNIEDGDFFVLCGASGSGKSTLLRHLKTDLAPRGELLGEILFCGQPLNTADRRTQSSKIGFVGQSPENQIVTDKVWHELAFGLECLGCENSVIRSRVAEMSSFFGINKLFHKNISELSGGQKQLLALASVMTLCPTVLILDEPTSQLDPIAASEFLNALKKVNSELGVTIILTEHRLEEAFSLASKAAVLEKGMLICSGAPKEVCASLKAVNSGMFGGMPAAVRIWGAVASDLECPVTPAEGRRWLNDLAAEDPLGEVPKRSIPKCSEETAVSISEAWFRYEKDGEDIIRGLDLDVKKGEFLAILGGNGAGKTTALKLMSGLKDPYRGDVRVSGKIAALPQDPRTLFVKKTLRDDLLEMTEDMPEEIARERYRNAVSVCRLGELLDRHPYDLSGGEQQRAALAKILIPEADILLLDEPTKGFDPTFKQLFGTILTELSAQGITIIMVSHDVEFCAEYAHRCALLFDGSIVSDGTPQSFFSGNSFYTTSANRIAREHLPTAVTVNDVISACGGELPKTETAFPAAAVSECDGAPNTAQKKKLPLWRRFTAFASAAAAFFIFVYASAMTDLSKSVDISGTTELGRREFLLYGSMIAALFVFAFSVYRRGDVHENFPHERKKIRLSGRAFAAGGILLLVIPITLFIAVKYLGMRQYYVISVGVLIECMLPFFIAFEGRKPQARELVTIASLCATAIAGRAVFFMLPQFKPVAAIVIISGIALGGETGFLVGAVTMLASNIMFSQGPWTPFQMFAMGMIGFFAGVFSRLGVLRRSRLTIAVFGAISVILIYGGLMDPASALIWGGETLSREVLITYYVTGFPMNLIHALATAVFLWFGALPMLEKLDRLKTKYGVGR